MNQVQSPTVLKKDAHTLRKSSWNKEAAAGYWFALPGLLGLLLWYIGPMVASFVISFSDWKVITGVHWVGIKNYADIFFHDIFFWKSLAVTFYFTVGSVVMTMIASLIVALFMNKNIFGQGLFRAVFYLPTIVPIAAASILWMWLFNPDFGLFNELLSSLGLPKSNWIYGEGSAVPSLILMSIWGCGGPALILLAGLQDIPAHLLEAVEIDGGRWWHKFRYVMIPTISPVIFFNLVMGLIQSFQAFAQPYIMTKGGPNNATLFYLFLIYREAFQHNNMGYACALAWILFVIIAIFTLLIFRTSNKWVYYGGGS